MSNFLKFGVIIIIITPNFFHNHTQFGVIMEKTTPYSVQKCPTTRNAGSEAAAEMVSFFYIIHKKFRKHFLRSLQQTAFYRLGNTVYNTPGYPWEIKVSCYFLEAGRI